MEDSIFPFRLPYPSTHVFSSKTVRSRLCCLHWEQSMVVMGFAAFWACYHSNFCRVTGFSRFLTALCITFVPLVPSGDGWARGLGEDGEGGRSLWQGAVSHRWAVELLVPSSCKESVSAPLLPFLRLFPLMPSGRVCELSFPWSGWNHTVPPANSGLLPAAALAPSLHIYLTFTPAPSFAMRAGGQEGADFPSPSSWCNAPAARLGSLHPCHREGCWEPQHHRKRP